VIEGVQYVLTAAEIRARSLTSPEKRLRSGWRPHRRLGIQWTCTTTGWSRV